MGLRNRLPRRYAQLGASARMRNARHCQNAHIAIHTGAFAMPAENTSSSRNRVRPSGAAETAIECRQLRITASAPVSGGPSSRMTRTPSARCDSDALMSWDPIDTNPKSLARTRCPLSVHCSGNPPCSSETNRISGVETARNTRGFRIALHAASGGQSSSSFSTILTNSVCTLRL